MADLPRGWSITGQVHDQVIPTAAGRAITGSYVYFMTNLGEEGSVFVPENVYNVETVKKMVAARAKVVDHVHILVGSYE